MTGLIVVGCDGSDEGQAAVNFAVTEGVLRDAKVAVVSAWSYPVSVYPMAMMPSDAGWGEDIITGTEKMAQEGLDLALEHAGHPKLETEAQARQGRPSAVLLEAAANADLLVVGARGNGVWGRLALGSTSTEVVHHASVPVVVIPCHRETVTD